MFFAIFEPWASWCEEFLEACGNLSEARLVKRAARQFRNAIETMFWGAGKQFWDLATH